ncbi:MAG: rRNA pseudouridine synthase [Thermoflexales bacterium]|nr:rRNA pseudouridine synthase [Thermoflexales bacterium]
MKPQRYLAVAGLGSRRACEALIKAGRVTRNGEQLTFNQDIGEGDDVRVDGAPVRAPSAPVYVALHKPAGLISDRGARGARSALDLVPGEARLFPVGRLDIDATGLLLLTNDGELALTLTHPRYEHDKEYRVLVDGVPGARALAHWRKGIILEGEERPTAPAKVEVLPEQREAGATWLSVTLHEGRKRQIKRVAKAVGHPVRRLIRVRIGPLKLGDLEPGKWRALAKDEIDALLNASKGRA